MIESNNIAINEFISRYPGSDKVEDFRKINDELTQRLHKKTYLNAYTYYKIGRYKSAVPALKNAAPQGVDFLLDAAGSAEFLVKATPALKQEGAVCSYASGLDKIAFFQNLTVPNYWKFIRQGPYEDKVHDHFLTLIRMKVLPFSLFYSHVLPLSSITEGFELIRNKKAHKIVFTME